MRDIEDVLLRTIDSLRAVTDCDAVVGKPFRAEDGTVLIPVSRVSYGFVAGGGEYPPKSDGKECYPCAAASGGGMTVTPMGFLVSVAAVEKEEKWKELLRAALKAVKGGEDEE